MVALYGKLRRARVPVEAHFFQTGEHGVALRPGRSGPRRVARADVQLGPSNGWLTGKPRVAVNGMVKLDGEPLPRGEVILTPLDPPAAPSAPRRSSAACSTPARPGASSPSPRATAPSPAVTASRSARTPPDG